MIKHHHAPDKMKVTGAYKKSCSLSLVLSCFTRLSCFVLRFEVNIFPTSIWCFFLFEIMVKIMNHISMQLTDHFTLRSPQHSYPGSQRLWHHIEQHHLLQGSSRHLSFPQTSYEGWLGAIVSSPLEPILRHISHFMDRATQCLPTDISEK